MSTSNFYQFTHEGEKPRNHPCSLCGESKGSLVGKMNYIGLEHTDVLQCPECGLVSFDPLPSVETIREGALRQYQSLSTLTNKKLTLKDFGRSFRRGGSFARHHLKKWLSIPNPKILEINPGNGYFAQGIKTEYPEAEVYYVDVVEELIRYYLGHFECRARSGEFTPELFPEVKFDIVIMKDFLEHSSHPVQLLKNIRDCLSENGVLFFTTPNGREDFWSSHQRYINNKEEALTLENHIHYFLPETLDRMLAQSGFSKVNAFKFGLKDFKKGVGVKEVTDFLPQELPSFQTELPKKLATHYWKHHPSEIHWSLVHSKGPLAKMISFLADREREVVSFDAPQGREFFVLAKKT